MNSFVKCEMWIDELGISMEVILIKKDIQIVHPIMNGYKMVIYGYMIHNKLVSSIRWKFSQNNIRLF